VARCQHADRGRVAIEQQQRIGNRAARQQIACFMFLKGARATADQIAGGSTVMLWPL
jgi:hypothetical protein